MTEWLSIFRTMLADTRNIVFFGGAGVSTASGIPDFRSSDGLYRKKFPWSAEEILSHSFFYSHTEDFFRFYRQQMIFPTPDRTMRIGGLWIWNIKEK